MRLVFDLETDGLLAEATKIHCLVIKNMDTGSLISCADQPGYVPLQEGLTLLSQARRLYAHNGLRFDIPILEKLVPGWSMEGELVDTMLCCQLRFAHIRDSDFEKARRSEFPTHLIGRQTLESWGRRLGVYKGSYEDGWETWTPAMQEYCEQDVIVNEVLVNHLAKSGLPAKAVVLEHKLATYLSQQEENGWPFNVAKATALHASLTARREEIGSQLIERFGTWLEKDGPTRTPKRSMTRRKGLPCPQEFHEGCEYTKLKEVEFNPGSRGHIVKRLGALYGWKPTEFTSKGNPKVDETTLSGLPYPEAELLVEYFTLEKILGYVVEGQKAWLVQTENNSTTGLPHIHHSCGQGPRTHRIRHMNPNLGQVPKVGSPYGAECRDLFHVPAGWQMLGADVSGLELRMLAEYLMPFDEGEYADHLLNGDIHQRVADALGTTRDEAKTVSYATLYGAGNEKVGSLFLPTGSEEAKVKKGRKVKKGYLDAIVGMRKLNDGAKRATRKRGYVKLLDGRRAYPKAEYSALNTLLQGSGAIVCKTWYVNLCESLEAEFGPQGWSGKWAMLGFIHDEVQMAVRPEIADRAAKIAVECIAQAGLDLGVKIPLTGESKIGSTWADTH